LRLIFGGRLAGSIRAVQKYARPAWRSAELQIETPRARARQPPPFGQRVGTDRSGGRRRRRLGGRDQVRIGRGYGQPKANRR
jgi:hypothetical protein